MSTPFLSVVIPCFNESQVIDATISRLLTVLRGLRQPFEIIFVDDGSSDHTPALLHQAQRRHPEIKILIFSRNFGQQAAVTAGLKVSSGSAVVLMDADLQDPPELIKDMIAQWQQGYDVVYGQRRKRHGENFMKILTANLFYKLAALLTESKFPRDTGDFRLMDRKVVDALMLLPEHDRFVRGLVAWVGFRQLPLLYDRPVRHAGVTKYNLVKMLGLAKNAIFSLSTRPLLLPYLGVAVMALLVLGGLVWQAGSVFLLVTVVGAGQFLCLAIFGEYLARIYSEAKNRPLYVVREQIGFASEGQQRSPTDHSPVAFNTKAV